MEGGNYEPLKKSCMCIKTIPAGDPAGRAEALMTYSPPGSPGFTALRSAEAHWPFSVGHSCV